MTSPAAAAQGATLKRNLGLWAIVGLGLGYMTPTVLFDTFGMVADETSNLVPLAYAVALVVMTFTAISYGKISREIPSAGSAYTYVRESIHPNVGFLVGWTSLVDYVLLPLVNALIIRNYLEQLFPEATSGIWAGWWVIAYCVLTTTVIYFTMRGTSNLNMVLLVFSILVMVVFVVLAWVLLQGGEGSGTVASMKPFFNSDFSMAAVLAGATIVCFSFIGFDAVTMYAEEAKHPSIMPKAILLTVLIGGGIFLVAGYFTQLLVPDSSAFTQESLNNSSLTQIGEIVGGKTFQAILTAAGFACTLASGLASHASVSRMLLVMGRNNVIPRGFFGHINPKTHTPSYNVLLVGAICLTAIFVDLDVIASFINFGALIAFTFVNISVIAWFAIRKGLRHTPRDIFKYIVMPALGMLMTVMLWVNLDSLALTGGGIWLGIGFIYLIFITKGFKKKVAAFDENQPVTGYNKIPEGELENLVGDADGDPDAGRAKVLDTE